jgi:hypothetical protein
VYSYYSNQITCYVFVGLYLLPPWGMTGAVMQCTRAEAGHVSVGFSVCRGYSRMIWIDMIPSGRFSKVVAVSYQSPVLASRRDWCRACDGRMRFIKASV